ncbi:hypothetical protein HPP92_014766 [Vanilla planifolia]|uniref:RecF/RecN/SMC N-terminal domain-containing protein n=1 Tax=Vanilla planifolia TaxID=51239 RepID=A0A835QHY3_VANPL|nr:hypothetical protein HPP92_014766 [Vanilla planifolia]
MIFTAIIGPNGAGKSNLMDAISFVLGVRSTHLRGAQLRDLIYASDDREGAEGKEAYVQLVYQMGTAQSSCLRGPSLVPAAAGDVESIASKNPKELTVLLEQISGSDELKRTMKTLEEQKARAEEKSALVYQEKRTIVMEESKSTQKEEAEKHLHLQDQLMILLLPLAYNHQEGKKEGL